MKYIASYLLGCLVQGTSGYKVVPQFRRSVDKEHVVIRITREKSGLWIFMEVYGRYDGFLKWGVPPNHPFEWDFP